MSEEESLLERARRRAKERGYKVSEPESESGSVHELETESLKSHKVGDFEVDLIPAAEPGREDDADIDDIIESIDILDAYNRWCGKMTPDPGSRRESVMVSCPRPDHPDNNPSAWLNLDDNLWFCGGCQEGGDKFDIAAWHFGFDVPGYKSGKNFPDLRRQMAEDLGYTITITPTGKELIQPPGKEPEVADSEPSDLSEEEALAQVIKLADPSEASLYPYVPWRDIIPPDTFLYSWMQTTTRDDSPDEFFFWLGMTALGLATGRSVQLNDLRPVNPNLFLCLVGSSGSGKSRATYYLDRLLGELPYDREDPKSTGVRIIGDPGSGEALIDQFSAPIPDAVDPSKIAAWGSVRGVLEISEMAGFVGKAVRKGNVTKQVLMDLYDCRPHICLKSRTHGEVEAHDPFCSMVTTTQPGAIRDLLTHHDALSGFLNRWVFAFGQAKRYTPIGGTTIRLDEPQRMLRRVHTWGSPGRQVEIREEALDYYVEFAHKKLGHLKEDEERAMLARMDLTIKKIILLFAINERVIFPDADLIERATSLLGYLIESYGLVEDRIVASRFNEVLAWIEEHMRRFETSGRKPPTMKRLIRDAPTRFDTRTVTDGVKLLEQAGMIVELAPKNQRGPQAVRYALTPDEDRAPPSI